MPSPDIRPSPHWLLPSHSRRSGALLRNGMGPKVMQQSGDCRGGGRNAGAVGKAIDMDTVEAQAGACSRVVVPKLLPELHPEASENVPAFVAIGDGPRAPLGVARRDLDDGAVAGVGDDHGLDRRPLGGDDPDYGIHPERDL